MANTHAAAWHRNPLGDGLHRLVRPMSVPHRGTVFLAIEDVTLRREVLAGLWLAGIDVEEVLGLGVLCARLVGAPFLGPSPDVVVWDAELGPLSELDAVWHRYGEGPSPALVVVADANGASAHGVVEMSPRDPQAIRRAVERALDAKQRTPVAAAPSA